MPKKDSEIVPSGMSTKDFKEYYNSVQDILLEYSNTHIMKKEKKDTESKNYEGYPTYPPSEDIYNKEKEETELNPEDPSKTKTPNEAEGTPNEKGFKDDKSGDDLDIPGSELDDQQESVGSEDEENNYYSLGGDNHNDLDEDKG
ncbi:hypothetical protein [Aequorivita sp. CIP111184]|uniref:hypothetical protein n=1 Tax=Aequorivita sp. CIP111184 TaxID=2211356 RepID=UPI000DBC41C5|nr:hypothetical protein [Aequorivita sp. CIP111184]SRX55451.1 hypothetical protein AEQU1_02473 [Aequorivita sp. CIP111184]